MPCIDRQTGDELLVLAQDDDTYSPSRAPAASRPGTCPQWSSCSEPERLLFVGWCVLGRHVQCSLESWSELLMPGGRTAKEQCAALQAARLG